MALRPEERVGTIRSWQRGARSCHGHAIHGHTNMGARTVESDGAQARELGGIACGELVEQVAMDK